MTLQTFVDAREDLNIRAYEVWQGWAQQHALAEIEKRLRGEGGGGIDVNGRLSLLARASRWLSNRVSVHGALRHKS